MAPSTIRQVALRRTPLFYYPQGVLDGSSDFMVHCCSCVVLICCPPPAGFLQLRQTVRRKALPLEIIRRFLLVSGSAARQGWVPQLSKDFKRVIKGPIFWLSCGSQSKKKQQTRYGHRVTDVTAKLGIVALRLRFPMPRPCSCRDLH